MKFDRSKEIERYIKSLDECEAFDEVKVVNVEKFDRFDRFTIGIYLKDQLYKIAHVSMKNGSIVTNEEFESQIKMISQAVEVLKTLSSTSDDSNRAPKEITTSITGTRR